MNWKIASSSMFKTHNAGFSLIELLVVLVIIGLLAAMIVPNVIGRAD